MEYWLFNRFRYLSDLCIHSFFRRSIPYPFPTIALLLILFFDSTVSIITAGHTSLATTTMLSMSIAADLLLGIRAGLVLLGINLTLYISIAIFHFFNIIDFSSITINQSTSIQSWITRGLALLLHGYGILIIIKWIHFRLSNAGINLANQSEILQNKNEELKLEIQKRELIQQNLRIQEEHYRLLAQNINDVLFVLDNNLQIAYLSPSFTLVFGIDANLTSLLTRETLFTFVTKSLQQINRYQESHGDYDYANILVPLSEEKFTHPNGSIIWGETNLSIKFNASGSPIGYQGTIRDISQRKLHEQEKIVFRIQLCHAEK